jgi:hypothetical protein
MYFNRSHIFTILVVFLVGCGTSEVVKGPNSTYTVSAQYGSLNGSWGRASQEAMQRAQFFCDVKDEKFVFLGEQRDGVLGWSPQVSTITFRCGENRRSLISEKKDTNSATKNDSISSKLNPSDIRKKSDSDSVAIIIGIQNYKRLGKADFANLDAEKFAEYAHRALGIPKSRIKTLTDADADQAALLKTFRNWLPLQITKDKTNVFVFYSGHGLPSADGKSLFLLPYGVDHDLLDETAVDQRKIIAAIQAAKPKSVTMFIDSCYSGLSKSGDVLLAGAKPVSMKNTDIGYPPDFTVMTASSPDQISSASTDLQHGIFSFYLMKGMEGGADLDKDGKITVGEMHKFLMDNVPRQAMEMNRKQEPQLIGDPSQVLVGR